MHSVEKIGKFVIHKCIKKNQVHIFVYVLRNIVKNT